MKNFLKEVTSKIKSLFSFLVDKVRDNSELAVKITQKLKDAVESQLAGVAVTIFPGEVDDFLLAKARQVMPKVLATVTLSHNILDLNPDDSDAIEKLIQKLSEMHPELRASFWVSFAGQLNVALADGKISLAEGIMLTQFVYLQIKSTK